jgi:hypothetical protein
MGNMPAPKGHTAYPGSENGGRPKMYTAQFIEDEATAFEEWMQRPDSVWFKDFALERSYDPDLLAIWAKENEKFSGVYRRAQHWQQSKLIKGGLLNLYNASITKLVLANTCGWTDRQQVSGDTGNPLAFVLNRIDGASKELLNHEN